MTKSDKKVIIFEGPDRCGKSTQAELLAKKLKNCIFIHSPRTQNDTTKCFKMTMDTIYNKDFMNGFIDVKNNDYEKLMDYRSKLIDALTKNIEINFEDRKDVLENIESIYKGESHTFDFAVKKDYMLFLNGEKINDPIIEISKVVELLKKFSTHPEECYIILDRFELSGFVYNRYVPQQVINEYKIKFFTETMNDDSISAEKKKEVFDALDFVISVMNSTYSRLINYSGVNDMYRNFDCYSINFKFSHLISNIVKNSSENDAYDNDDFIKRYSRELYEFRFSHSNMKNSYDTDNLFLQSGISKPEDINKKIYENLMENINKRKCD